MRVILLFLPHRSQVCFTVSLAKETLYMMMACRHCSLQKGNTSMVKHMEASHAQNNEQHIFQTLQSIGSRGEIMCLMSSPVTESIPDFGPGPYLCPCVGCCSLGPDRSPSDFHRLFFHCGRGISGCRAASACCLDPLQEARHTRQLYGCLILPVV